MPLSIQAGDAATACSVGDIGAAAAAAAPPLGPAERSGGGACSGADAVLRAPLLHSPDHHPPPLAPRRAEPLAPAALSGAPPPPPAPAPSPP
eukprot:51815-Chlamydomonas_euryale.AAC.1